MLLKSLGLIAMTAILIFGGAIETNAQKRANKKIEVKIYLTKTEIDPGGSTSLELVAIKRFVNAENPLRSTLKALFAPVSRREKSRSLSSSTLGTKFEDVELDNGTMLVKFSEPPGDASADIEIFRRAIEKTAKQFSDVKRVEICAVGETLIDSESENPFPRCTQRK